MNKLIDIHCHLDHPYFQKNLDSVIERARKAGLKAIVTAGIDHDSNRKTLELAKKYDLVKAALGIYPLSVLEKERSLYNIKAPASPTVIDEEINFIKKNKDSLLLIGEIGLDLNLTNDLKDQKELFLKMIQLAEKLNKPILVHSRKAEKEVLDTLESTKIKKVIMHCFSGNLSLVKKIENNGWFLSIPTNVVRSSHFQEIVKRVDINLLLTETDAPFLSPFKDKKNEPAFITETIKKIAELKGMDPIEVENNLFMNYNKVI